MSSEMERQFVEGAARAAFVMAWVEREENHGRHRTSRLAVGAVPRRGDGYENVRSAASRRDSRSGQSRDHMSTSIRRSKPQRVRATVLITSTDTDADSSIRAWARLRGRSSEDVLRLARHLGYQRRAETVEVWVWRQRKRRVGERVRRTETCERWTYDREHDDRGHQRRLILTERARVSRNEIPKRPRMETMA